MGAKPASAWAAAIDEEILRFLFDFGATAAIGEMLLDSRPGDLRLLPALPAALPDGEAEGLTAQGGAAVSLAWGLGHLIRATLRATRAQGTDDSLRGKFDLDPSPCGTGQDVLSWGPAKLLILRKISVPSGAIKRILGCSRPSAVGTMVDLRHR